MPTRRDLHAQARQAQRHQLQAARSDNPKSAIVGIGARDPQTGLFDVLLPDGSTELGEKTFNSALPQGSQVLGIPKESGGWVLDERDVAPSPIAPVVEEPTGKIKYLYSVLNADGSRDLWIGGWQPKPVKIKAIAVGEGGFYLRNTGGRRYFIDYGAGNVVISFTERSELYRYDLTGFGGTVGFYGYSFGADGASGGGPGEHGYWSNLFQGVFSGGLNTDGVGIFGKVYLLPKLLSPVGKIPGLEGLVYRTYAINQSGTKGIGVRIDYDPTLVGGGETIAAYSTPGGIVDTGVNILTIRTGAIDCFDDDFSAIDTSTFSTDVLSKPKGTGTIGIYGFDAIQQRTAKTIVYGIPAAQRSSATLIGRPSYHPRTTTLKP